MTTHQLERFDMVRRQLKQQGIRDPRVLDVMGRLPRHSFVDPALWEAAYSPKAVPIGEGQTISQPYMVALMTEQLTLRGGERALEIGTGSGYQAAVLHALGCSVITVERIPSLAHTARRTLDELAPECVVLVGDGSRGAPVRGLFDRIVVTAGSPEVPQALLAQLADPGILVCPVGTRDLQSLVRVVRQGGQDVEDRSCPCRFVPLVGNGGWPSA